MANNTLTKAQLEDKNKELKSQVKEKDNKISELEESIKKIYERLDKMGETPTHTKGKKIDGDEDIAVTSLCPHQLNLTTEGQGQGTVYTFEEYGETQDIPMSELRYLVKNNNRFFKDGLAIIENKDAVAQLRLKKYYNDNLLDADTLKTLLDRKSADVIEMYKLAPKGQKDIIVEIILNKKYNGEDVDANVLIELGEMCGKDLLNAEDPNKE